MKSMKLSLVVGFGLGVLAFVSIVGAQAPLQSDHLRFEEARLVTATSVPRSEGEYFLTFNGPIAVPGVSLGAGTYLFRFPAQGVKVIQVLKADRSDTYAMFDTIPVFDVNRSMSSGAEMTWMERRADAPRAIRTWYLPGQATGYEFVYPKAVAK